MKEIYIKTPEIEITFQPINGCWGVNMKLDNWVINEVDTTLCVALLKAITKYSPKLTDYKLPPIS